MSKSDSIKDRRKYQRVLVEPSSKILAVAIEGYGPTLVFDMSYSGAALAQPQAKKVSSPDEIITLHLKTEVDEATISAKVIRVGGEVIAVAFEKIGVVARIIIDRVVTDRIVGLNMSFIEPKHYNAKADFTHWFHGPKETNFYFWWAQDKLLKAHLELDSAFLLFEHDTFLFENKENLGPEVPRLNNQQIALKALAILEQMDPNLEPLRQFKQVLKSHVQS